MGVEVLRELRKHDERYRLVLMGDDPEPKIRQGGAGLRTKLWSPTIERLEPSSAIIRLARSTDVAKALVEVGVILSTSVRESFHCALVEGAASGAVPVVRDWPFFAGKEHGAQFALSRPTGWSTRRKRPRRASGSSRDPNRSGARPAARRARTCSRPGTGRSFRVTSTGSCCRARRPTRCRTLRPDFSPRASMFQVGGSA